MGKFSIIAKLILAGIMVSCFIQGISQVKVNVKDYGATGNGKSDDWEAIQMAIDFVSNKGGGEIYFPTGMYAIYNQTLVVWGSNIKLIGQDREKVVLLRKGRPGWWGELLSISGKSPGGKYYGGMGTTDYKRFIIYRGVRIQSENIQIQNLTFDNEIPYPKNANNIGIVNSKDVIIDNCTLKNAPQSNVAIVNDTNKAFNRNVILSNCSFLSSGQHNVRVISYNQGSIIGNLVEIKNCEFIGVKGKDTNREIKGKKVHLWYRAGTGSKNVKLVMDNCYVDATGIIASTVNSSNLVIQNSTIEGLIELKSNKMYLKDSEVKIINNSFSRNNPKPIIYNVERKVIQNNKIID